MLLIRLTELKQALTCHRMKQDSVELPVQPAGVLLENVAVGFGLDRWQKEEFRAERQQSSLPELLTSSTSPGNQTFKTGIKYMN